MPDPEYNKTETILKPLSKPNQTKTPPNKTEVSPIPQNEPNKTDVLNKTETAPKSPSESNRTSTKPILPSKPNKTETSTILSESNKTETPPNKTNASNKTETAPKTPNESNRTSTKPILPNKPNKTETSTILSESNKTETPPNKTEVSPITQNEPNKTNASNKTETAPKTPNDPNKTSTKPTPPSELNKTNVSNKTETTPSDFNKTNVPPTPINHTSTKPNKTESSEAKRACSKFLNTSCAAKIRTYEATVKELIGPTSLGQSVKCSDPDIARYYRLKELSENRHHSQATTEREIDDLLRRYEREISPLIKSESKKLELCSKAADASAFLNKSTTKSKIALLDLGSRWETYRRSLLGLKKDLHDLNTTSLTELRLGLVLDTKASAMLDYKGRLYEKTAMFFVFLLFDFLPPEDVCDFEALKQKTENLLTLFELTVILVAVTVYAVMWCCSSHNNDATKLYAQITQKVQESGKAALKISINKQK